MTSSNLIRIIALLAVIVVTGIANLDSMMSSGFANLDTVIHLRFVQVMGCVPGASGCNDLLSPTKVTAILTSLNDAFAPAGISFAIDANDRFHMPTLSTVLPGDATNPVMSWGAVKNEIHLAIPGMPLNAYADAESKKPVRFIQIATSGYSPTTQATIWVAPQRSNAIFELFAIGGAGSGDWPWIGRAIEMEAEFLAADASNGIMIHEIGHFLGITHANAPYGRDPNTGVGVADEEVFDLVFCSAGGSTPRFYDSWWSLHRDRSACTAFSPIDRSRANCRPAVMNNPSVCSPGSCSSCTNCFQDSSSTSSELRCTVQGTVFSSSSAGSPLRGLSIDLETIDTPPSRFRWAVPATFTWWVNSSPRPGTPFRFGESQIQAMRKHLVSDMPFDPTAADWQTLPFNGIGAGSLDRFSSKRDRLSVKREKPVWRSAINWCSHANGEVFVGRFDADDRADLLCHDRATGEKWVLYATSAGEFMTSNGWYTNSTFCGHQNGRLHVADLDGDRRDDLLCHDVANGDKWAAFADTNGKFEADQRNWFNPMRWCSHANGQVYVADLTGDGRADMLCHDTVTGSKWILYASLSGRFSAANEWSSAMNWCVQATEKLMVGDVDADGYSDLICHATVQGVVHVAFNDRSGHFAAPGSWMGNLRWCSQDSGMPGIARAADMNGDGSADLYCHFGKGNYGVSTILYGRKGSRTDPFANKMGRRWSTSSSTHWCNSPTESVYLGDFAGAGLGSSVLCHETQSGAGSFRVAYPNFMYLK